MKPIWPEVDQTRPPFTSVRTSMTAVAKSAVTTPRAKARAIALTDEANTGENRISSTPAPLTTPACNSADTGVGAANVDGNQPWSGTSADRLTPAITRQIATSVSTLSGPIDSASSATASKPTLRRSMSPTITIATTMPSSSAESPMRNVRAVRRCDRTAAGHGALWPSSATRVTLVATHARRSPEPVAATPTSDVALASTQVSTWNRVARGSPSNEREANDCTISPTALVSSRRTAPTRSAVSPTMAAPLESVTTASARPSKPTKISSASAPIDAAPLAPTASRAAVRGVAPTSWMSSAASSGSAGMATRSPTMIEPYPEPRISPPRSRREEPDCEVGVGCRQFTGAIGSHCSSPT